MLCFAFDGGSFEHRRRDNLGIRVVLVVCFWIKGGFPLSRNCLLRRYVRKIYFRIYMK